MSEGVRLGLDKKIARMGSTLTYVPFVLLIERPRMTPYHEKFLVRRAPSATLGKNAVDG